MIRKTLTGDEVEVGEPETDQETPEVSSEESAELTPEQLEEPGQEPTEETPQEPEAVYYTPEEMRELDFNDVDTSRIPAEMMPFYKSMESGVQRKFQEIARAREQLQQQTQRPVYQPPIQEVYQNDPTRAFMQDPEGTMRVIDQQIVQAQQTDPFKATELLHLKTNLMNWHNTMSQKSAQIQNVVGQVQQKLVNEIPDFASIQSELSDFAIKRMGYSAEEIGFMTDPRIVGDLAYKNVKNVYDNWKRTQTLKTPPKKKPKEPTKVETPGAGDFATDTKEKWDDNTYFNSRLNKEL